MKKICVVVVVLIVLMNGAVLYASIVSRAVQKIQSAAAVWSAGGIMTVPAQVSAVTNTGAQALSWLALQLPPARTAKIAGAIIGIGGAMALDYLWDKGSAWFQANGYNRVNGEMLEFVPGVKIPDPAYPAPSNWNFIGWFSDGGDLCYNAINAFYNSNTMQNWGGVSSNYQYKDPAWSSFLANYRLKSAPTEPLVVYCVYKNGGTGQYSPDTWGAVNTAGFETKLSASLGTDNVEARKVAGAGLQVAEAAVADPQHKVRSFPAAWGTIADELNASISGAQDTALEGGAVAVNDAWAASTAATLAANPGMTAQQVQAAVQSALEAQGLNQADIQAAVQGALNNEAGVSVPVDPTITNPTKLSLTTVMGTFMSSLNALPIMNTLNGITISASGSSSLCLNMAAKYGGQRCYNAGAIQSEINMMGTALLSLTTIFMFLYLFKG